MKKVLIAVLLGVCALFIATTSTPSLSTSKALSPVKPETNARPVSAPKDPKWVQLEDGSKNGTRISLDVANFEVVTPGDVFEFIVMFEYLLPQEVDGEVLALTVISTQISCKTRSSRVVSDLSINIAERVVHENMVTRQKPGVDRLDPTSHLGMLAEFICTRGNTLEQGPEKHGAPSQERRQANPNA